MTTIRPSTRRRLPPSKKALKILCKAHESKEFPKGPEGDWLRWRHGDEVRAVIKKLLRANYKIRSTEVSANGGRVDLLVSAPDERTIAVEVKPRKGEFRELDKIQGALYWTPQFDAVAIASRHSMLVLTPDYVQEVRIASHVTDQFMETQPELARVSFTPHPDVCWTCINELCPQRGRYGLSVQAKLNA
jgi:hypothetical protein